MKRIQGFSNDLAIVERNWRLSYSLLDLRKVRVNLVRILHRDIVIHVGYNMICAYTKVTRINA